MKIQVADWNAGKTWYAHVDVHLKVGDVIIGTATVIVTDDDDPHPYGINTPIVVYPDGLMFTPSWDGDQFIVNAIDDIIEQIAEMTWYETTTGREAVILGSLPRLFPA